MIVVFNVSFYKLTQKRGFPIVDEKHMDKETEAILTMIGSKKFENVISPH